MGVILIKFFHHKANIFSLSWSSTNKIAFSYSTANPNIYTLNPDGSNIKQLTFGSYYNKSPSFSPNGTEIFYSSNETGDLEIWKMNVDGSNKTNISNSPSTYDEEPYVSPDGKKIVYVSCPVGSYSESNELWILDLSTGSKSRITYNSFDDGLPIWFK